MADVANSLQSTLALLQISTDAGTTKKSLVCLTAANFAGTTPVNREDSWCGTAVGLGSNTFEWTADFILNTAPSGTEISYEGLLAIWHAQTLALLYDSEPADGSNFYSSASVYITNITKTQQAGQLIKASITFSGVGVLDIVA